MSENIGSILGYLRLDRSDWDNEIRAAMAKADELGRKSPNIKIGTNAPTAIAQLAAVSAAVRKLQDAQGAEGVAQAKLAELQSKGNVSAGRLAAAEERVAKAHRATASATIGLAAAQDANDKAMIKAAADTAKLSAQADKTTASFKMGLIPALLAISPAAVPIAGVAGGALLGLLPVAATVSLGIKGIEDQMKKGAVQGTAFAASVNALKSELGTLEQNAAGGLMSGITTALAKSGPLFGEVNRDVAEMSGEIGQIVGSAGPSLVKILTDLNPLFQTFGQALVHGAGDLEHWANSSNGISRFVAYVQSELPDVEHLFENLITLITHLAEGAAPVGDGLLHVLNGITRALDAIPVNVLTEMTAAFVLLYPAVKTIALINAGLTTLGVLTVNSAQKAELAAAQYQAASLQRQAAAAADAAVVVRAEATKAEATLASERQRQALLAGTGTAEAAEADAATVSAEQYATAKQAEATAAERSAAQIRAAAVEATAASTAQADAMAASSRAGMARGGALLGLAAVPAIAAVAGKALADYTEKGNAFAHTMDHAGSAQDSFNQALLESKGAIDASVTATVQAQLQQDGLAAKAARAGITMEQLTAGVTGNSKAFALLVQQWEASGKPSGDTIVALGQLHLQFGLSRDAASRYASQQRDTTDTVTAGTKAFTDYRTALHQAQAAILALGQTELAQAASEDAFKEGLLGVRKAVHDNGTSLSDQTAKGLANRDMLIQLLQQANAVAQSQQKNHVAIPKVTEDLIANVKQLEQTATKAGLSKDAVHKLIAEMQLTPKDIRSTFKTNAGTVIDEVSTIRQRLQDLTAVDWQINMHAVLSGGIANVGAGVKAKAAGGKISGPGTGTSDSIIAAVSNGEFVSTANSTDRNEAALEAGNRGAKLVALPGYANGGKIVLGHAMHATSPAYDVAQAVAGSVAPSPSTVSGWRAWLAVATQAAVAERAQYDAAKQNLDALRHHANELKNDAQNLANNAAAMKTHTKAERAAKDAAEERAKAAKKVADAANNMASRAQKAFDRIKQASQSATQKAKQDAQALVAAVQSEFDTLQQNIQTFESGISQGLTAGSDLATIWGNLGNNANSAKQALDAAQAALQQATPDTTKLAAAQAAQAQAAQAQAAAHAALTQALAGGDAAAILAAQQAQTTAAANLADAQAAVTANTPTADQLAAQAQAQQQLTAARQAYNQAVQAASAGGVADVLSQFKDSEAKFVADLNTLKAGGAGQALITQLAGMGVSGGDALAQGLINDPASLAAISKSMDAINNIAGKESDKLAQGYYGAGVKSMQQLLAGIEKQFPSLVKGLAPLAAQLAAMFTFTPTVAGTSGSAVGGKTITTDALHQLGTVAKQYGTTVAALIAANPSLKGDTSKSAIKKGTHLTIPSFASGVTDFGPGLAYVHQDEVLVNFPTAHNSVIPANRAKGAFAGGDLTPLLTEVRALRAEVRALPQATGQEVGAAQLQVIDRYGQAQADRQRRAVRRGPGR